MKVGMVVEGIPDIGVCTHFAKLVQPDIEVDPVALGEKPNLIKKCGDATKLFLENGCDHVVIIWDLYPAIWSDGHQSKKRGKQKKKTAPCTIEDRESIIKSLLNAGVDIAKVSLICIDAMLETWLLTGSRAIQDFLSKPHRPVRIKPIPMRRLKHIKDPKDELMTMFRQAGRRGRKPYNDVKDAVKIARAIREEPNDWNRLRKVDTFSRFAFKVAGVQL